MLNAELEAEAEEEASIRGGVEEGVDAALAGPRADREPEDSAAADAVVALTTGVPLPAASSADARPRPTDA